MNLKSVVIGNSLVATTNDDGSGSIQVEGNIGKVLVGDSLVGGGGERTGAIYSTRGNVGSVVIGGDLDGSSGFGSGSILVGGGMLKKVDIEGNIYGAVGTYSGTITGAQVGKVFVGGDINASTGIFNAQIRSLGEMGSVFVQGIRHRRSNLGRPERHQKDDREDWSGLEWRVGHRGACETSISDGIF